MQRTLKDNLGECRRLVGQVSAIRAQEEFCLPKDIETIKLPGLRTADHQLQATEDLSSIEVRRNQCQEHSDQQQIRP